MIKRRVFNVTDEVNESTQFKNCTTPLAKCVSGQRLQLVQSQFEAMIMPYNASTPLVESSMSQEQLTRSSCIQKLRGKVTILAKFNYQDLTYYFYRHKGIVKVLIDTKYIVNNGFAVRSKTDFEHLEVGVEYDVSDDNENFLSKYPTQYDPVSQTVAYGNNVNTVISTVRSNALDAIDVSENFVMNFTCLRDKEIKINLAKKKIISRYENIFPKLGEFIRNPMLFKVVKDDNTVSSLAQNPNIPAGYEDDGIILEPLTFINRIEVWCNKIIDDPILNKYREDFIKFRQDVYRFIKSLKEPYDDWVDNIRGNYEPVVNRNGTQDIKDPLIILYTKTVSVAEVESKFTNLNGGKVTIKDIYKDGKYKTKCGINIDVVYPANSLINRTISGALYEVHLNALGIFIDRAVREGKITPRKLYDTLYQMHDILGKAEAFKQSPLTPEDLFRSIEVLGTEWKIRPYDEWTTVQSMDKVTAIAEEVFGFKKLELMNGSLDVSDDHVVGKMFMMR